ncbi:MAG: hypothetical protein PHU85_08065 [Phycisphaerae bacterium]|nr:hypothetical protein [Phycisphaerae bacterium]
MNRMQHIKLRAGRADEGRRSDGGFMLIEAALTTVIVGVAVVALLAVIGASTRTNGSNRDMTRALFLAQEIREAMAPLPARQPNGRFGPDAGETLATFNDQDDFNGLSCSPPINAQRQTLSTADWSGWRQEVSVANVDPNYLAGHQTFAPGTTDMIRVTVTIRRGTLTIYQTSWLVAAVVEE